ncbi:MAG: DUF4249 domain-containing protein [Culturomica sp.]|jgi:hypothetical protein|nr:DUF4249 domain-containing protein [Culturomica sp.]
MKSTVLPLLSAALLAMACENEMDFKGDERTPKMYVNTILGPEAEERFIEVSESVFLFGNRKPQPVNNAAFKVWRNGAEVPVKHTTAEDSGHTLYTFSSPLSAGDKLELSGESPLHGAIAGSDVMPEPARIKEVKTEWFTGKEKRWPYEKEKSYLRTLVTLADKPEEKNYYRIIVRSETDYTYSYQKWDETVVTGESEYRQTHEVYVDREVLFNNNVGNVLAGDEEDARMYRIFSDELFAGREYTLNVYVQLDRTLEEWGNSGYTYEVTGQRVTIEILTLSENLFRHLRSVELAYIENNFSEPVKIYTNITGGYGIFGMYNVAEKRVEVPPFSGR